MSDGTPGRDSDIRSYRYKCAEDCPDADKHTPSPGGYLQWHEWAEKKAKTYEQRQCETCGFWAIWKRKRVSAAGGVTQ